MNYPSGGTMLLRENEEAPVMIPEVSAFFLSVCLLCRDPSPAWSNVCSLALQRRQLCLSCSRSAHVSPFPVSQLSITDIVTERVQCTELLKM